MYRFMSGERVRLSCKKLLFVSLSMLGDEMRADYLGHEVLPVTKWDSVNYSLEAFRRR